MNVGDAQKKPATRNVKLAPAWLGRRVGNFKLVALLGQGAMGRVFRAEDVHLQRQVALKLMPLQFKLGDKTIGMEQFVREARSAAALEHPGVVHVYEVNQAKDVFYIAMELLEGGSLRDLVNAGGPMDVVRACQLGAEAAEALGHAHQLGIVHRDVKPSNLMLSRGGRCKLTDFGLARIDDPGDSYHMGVEAVGTPLYMAPEIARGRPAESASDTYSLAATMCYLLTGHPPYEGGSVKEILDQHVSAPVPDLRERRPELPAALAEVVQKGLAKRPKDRFASAEQFSSALRVHTIPLGASGALPAVGGLSVAQIGSTGWAGSSGGTMTGSPAPSSKRLRNLLIGIGAVVVALIAAGIILLEISPPKPTPATVTLPPSADPAPAPTPTAYQPPSTFSATDYAAVLAIANNPQNPLTGKSVTVSGTASKTHLTSSGNLRVTFKGADEDVGFQLFCPVSVLKSMQEQFGGTNGTGIVGHKISVEGVVAMYKGRPEIRIDSAKQIHVTD